MKNIIINISYLLVVVAAVAYMPFQQYAPYLMIVGGAVLFVSHFAEKYDGNNIRLKRIFFIRHLIGLLYGLSAYFMFQHKNYWVICLMLSALLELYTVWVITKETK